LLTSEDLARDELAAVRVYGKLVISLEIHNKSHGCISYTEREPEIETLHGIFLSYFLNL